MDISTANSLDRTWFGVSVVNGMVKNEEKVIAKTLKEHRNSCHQQIWFEIDVCCSLILC